jgi:hypothetical protein
MKPEKLSREDKNILRTASIIGNRFSKEILYGILSPKMRTIMFTSLLSLVRSRWIVECIVGSGKKKSTEFSFGTVEYTFVHPLFYQTLYDLTPAGDKAKLHYAVATYIEESFCEPAHYAKLGHHFDLAKDCRSKALEYFVKAAEYFMSERPVRYDEGLEKIAFAITCADSAMDFATIQGIVIDKSGTLKNNRMLLFEIVQEAVTVPLGKGNSDMCSCFPRRNIKKRNIQDKIENSINSIQEDISLSGLTLRAIDNYLICFFDLREQLNNAFIEMTEKNCVGIIAPWQRCVYEYVYIYIYMYLCI